MAESLPHFESDTDDDDDGTTLKKKAGRVEVSPPSVTEAPGRGRQFKFGSELLRPLTVEAPKAPEPLARKPEAETHPVTGTPQTMERPAIQRDEVHTPPIRSQEAPFDLSQIAPEASAVDNDEGAPEETEHVEGVPAHAAPVTGEHTSEQRNAAAEAADDDAAFRDLIQHETGEDPGAVTLHDQTPGLPPVETRSEPESFDQWAQAQAAVPPGANTANVITNGLAGYNGPPVPPGTGGPHGANPNMPNQPPFAHGGGNQPPNGPPNPNMGAGNFGPNGPNGPSNPNIANAPWAAPAGNVLNPTTMAGISALEARQRLDSLHHTEREIGLAGAVGVLGLGLIIEHFRINKTRRMLKKQGKEQAKALSKTNKALQQEQYQHHLTQRKLERATVAQRATDEQLHKLATPSGRAAELAGTAMVLPAAERGNASMSLRQEKVLADRLEHSKELGRAIKRNPELQQPPEVDEIHDRELRQTIETATTTATEVTQLQHELQFERLRDKTQDAVRAAGGGGDGGGAHGALPTLPQPQLPTAGQYPGAAPSHVLADKSQQQSQTNLAKSVAIATVLIVLAAVLIMAFG